MKKFWLSATAALLLLAAGFAAGDKVRDWHDLDGVHKHIQEAIRELDRARAANHYDMEGHGVKAERLLHEAEHELNLAVESARRR
jgi:hypothetical protein